MSGSKKCTTLNEFLKNHKRNGVEEFTHTALGNPPKSYPGSYVINEDSSQEFLDLYFKHVFQDKKPAYLTEKHEKYSPILIDLDLRFTIDIVERQYTLDNIKSFLKIYVRNMVNILDLDESKMIALVM